MQSATQWVIAIISAAIGSAVLAQLNQAATPFDPTSFAIILIVAIGNVILAGKSATSNVNDDDEPYDGDPEEGTVKWFNTSKGFGFITRDDGSDIFVHHRSIRGQGNGRRRLIEGQRVTFVEGLGEKGPQADNVRTVRS